MTEDEKKKVPPLTDEEILWVRHDKKRAEAWGIVWTSIKRTGGIAVAFITMAYFFWDFIVTLVKKAAG